MTSPQNTTQRNGVRWYDMSGQGLGVHPSVTSILGVMDKPALVPWAAKMSAEYAAKNLELLSSVSFDEAVELVKGARFRGGEAKLGDAVHDAVERVIRGEDDTPPPDAVKGHLKGFAEFCELWEPEWVATELRVVNTEVGYAGSLDALALIDTGDGLGKVLTIIDHKTGKGVYPETAAQLCAYARATHAVTEDGRVMRMPKVERALVLHLRPRSWKAIPADIGADTWRAVRACAALAAWKWSQAPGALGAPLERRVDCDDSDDGDLVGLLRATLSR